MHDKKCCGDNPVMALGLARIGVGLFFTLFGAMKLFMMGPDAIVTMMSNLFGVTGAIALVMAWVVIITELAGGIAVLLGKLVPKSIYRLSLLGFAVITVVGFIAAHTGQADTPKQLLWHGMLLFVILGLMAAAPRCPMGITGKSCVKQGSCDTE